jgi:hypothetical protein
LETGVEPGAGREVPAVQVATALALLDAGRIAEARGELERALHEAGVAYTAPVSDEPGFEALGEAELDGAFDAASPESAAMIDADGIAFEAMRAARLDEPELAARRSAPAGAEGLPLGAPFQTRTMADLLERQGDSQSARAIRAALDPACDPALPEDDVRAQVIDTLERWLARLRGEDA